MIDHGGGFYRFEPTTEADRPSQPFPTRLSETGLFASVADHKPHPAALPLRRQCTAVGRRSDDRAVRRPAGPGADRAKASAQRGRRVDIARRLGPGADAQSRPGSTTPASRPASESRRACWSASRANGPVTPTAGTPSRPTPSWSPASGIGETLEVPDPAAAGRPSRARLAVPLPHRVPGLPLASGRLHRGLHSTPARPRPRLRRHHRQPASRSRAHRRVPGPAAHEARRPTAAGQPLRGSGLAGGPGQVVPARQLLDLPRQRGRRQLSHGAGAHHPDRQDAADRSKSPATTASTSKTPASSPPAHPSGRCSTSESRAAGPARCLRWRRPRSTARPSRLIADWIRSLQPGKR